MAKKYKKKKISAREQERRRDQRHEQWMKDNPNYYHDIELEPYYGHRMYRQPSIYWS